MENKIFAGDKVYLISHFDISMIRSTLFDDYCFIYFKKITKDFARHFLLEHNFKNAVTDSNAAKHLSKLLELDIQACDKEVLLEKDDYVVFLHKDNNFYYFKIMS